MLFVLVLYINFEFEMCALTVKLGSIVQYRFNLYCTVFEMKGIKPQTKYLVALYKPDGFEVIKNI